jgi:hypothetical protein
MFKKNANKMFNQRSTATVRTNGRKKAASRAAVSSTG